MPLSRPVVDEDYHSSIVFLIFLFLFCPSKPTSGEGGAEACTGHRARQKWWTRAEWEKRVHQERVRSTSRNGHGASRGFGTIYMFSVTGCGLKAARSISLCASRTFQDILCVCVQARARISFGETEHGGARRGLNTVCQWKEARIARVAFKMKR